MKKIVYFISTFILLFSASCGDDEPAVTRVKPEAIDLGLSVKWASFNLGAYEPQTAGSLYGWGDSLGIHKTMDKTYPVAVSFSMIDGHEWTKVEWNSPYFGGKWPLENISGTDYDIAKYMWTGWRLPTKEEMEELITRCTWTLSSQDGVPVYRVTGPNGNSIIFPLGGIRTTDYAEQSGKMGYYWTANLLPISDQDGYYYQSNVACAAWAMTIDSKKSVPVRMEPQVRSYGLSVRPVSAK